MRHGSFSPGVRGVGVNASTGATASTGRGTGVGASKCAWRLLLSCTQCSFLNRCFPGRIPMRLVPEAMCVPGREAGVLGREAAL